MRLRIFLIAWFLCLPLATVSAPLPDNQVFQFRFTPFDANTLKLDWTIKKGYFLYKDRIWIDNPQNQYLHVGAISFPDPEIKRSKEGKDIPIYRHKLTLAVPVLANTGGETALTVHYQGCSDAGFCYPPQTRDIQLSFDKEHSLSGARTTVEAPPSAVPTPPSPSLAPPLPKRSSAEVKTLFLTASPAWVLVSFFGFGLLLAFTPCVLPMVPVLSSIIIGHGRTLSTRKAFLLSLTYVLSMSITYGVIGGIIALLGANLQILLQSPWILGAFSLVFVLLALSMFNVYEFRLPVSWQEGLAKVTRSHQGGHYLNAAIMGSMSILILSPCVTPPLIGALSYIADAGSVVLGLSALFFLGLGMGTPLLLIGASAGKFLPKAGKWMNTIKYIFGMVLLGLAIQLLERLLSPILCMFLWSLLFMGCGLGLKPFFSPQTSGSVMKQTIGFMLIIFGGFILYGASAGHTNPWQPLRATIAHTPLQSRKVVTTLAQAQQIMADAVRAEQPVLLDFYATWCESCQQIENNIMQTQAVAAFEDRMFIVQVDLSKNKEDTKALLAYFNVIAPPTFLFYDQTGKAIPDLTWVGALDLETLLARLKKIIESD